MAKRIYTGITDKNGFKVYTSDIVEMHYFFLGIASSGGVYEDETEVIGKVKVHWYNRKKEPQFCVEDSNGNKYPFSLMQEPSEECTVKLRENHYDVGVDNNNYHPIPFNDIKKKIYEKF